MRIHFWKIIFNWSIFRFLIKIVSLWVNKLCCAFIFFLWDSLTIHWSWKRILRSLVTFVKISVIWWIIYLLIWIINYVKSCYIWIIIFWIFWSRIISKNGPIIFKSILLIWDRPTTKSKIIILLILICIWTVVSILKLRQTCETI